MKRVDHVYITSSIIQKIVGDPRWVFSLISFVHGRDIVSLSEFLDEFYLVKFLPWLTYFWNVMRTRKIVNND